MVSHDSIASEWMNEWRWKRRILLVSLPLAWLPPWPWPFPFDVVCLSLLLACLLLQTKRLRSQREWILFQRNFSLQQQRNENGESKPCKKWWIIMARIYSVCVRALCRIQWTLTFFLFCCWRLKRRNHGLTVQRLLCPKGTEHERGKNIGFFQLNPVVQSGGKEEKGAKSVQFWCWLNTFLFMIHCEHWLWIRGSYVRSELVCFAILLFCVFVRLLFFSGCCCCCCWWWLRLRVRLLPSASKPLSTYPWLLNQFEEEEEKVGFTWSNHFGGETLFLSSQSASECGCIQSF